MAMDSISFSIEGEITLDTLSESMEALKKLLRRLTAELAPGADIRWVVDDLKGGSVHTTLRGSAVTGGSLDDVGKVAKGYAAIGRAVEKGEELPCGEEVIEAVEELLLAAKEDGSEATIAVEGEASRIDLQAWNRQLTSGRSRAIGSVTGVIKGINGSGQPYISVYGHEGGAAVRCFVDEEQLKWALTAWGATVYVQGRLTRDKRSRRRRDIRQIIRYWMIDKEKNGRFEDAFGVGEWRPGDPSSVELIRAARDSD